MKHEVIKQEWLESERGWGIRPDGYSVHLSKEHCKAYIEKYWKEMPNETPDEYSRPAGNPYTFKVGKSIYLKLVEARAKGIFGLRYYK